jgi:carboxyl-terminal processing protease
MALLRMDRWIVFVGGPTSVRRKSRLYARLRLLGAVLALAILTDCAGSTISSPLEQPGDATELYSDAYDEISDLYVEPKNPGGLAVHGLKALAKLDPRLAIDRQGGEVVLHYGGRVIEHLPAPPNGDASGWGATTSAALSAVRSASPEIAGTAADKVDETVFDGIVGSLDRFSRYATPEVARQRRAARDGFGGIGVTLDPNASEVRITAVIPDSPAARAGLQKDDRIVRIGDAPTARLSREDVVDRLRGDVDTRVVLTVERPGVAAPIVVALVRGFIVPPTVTTRIEDGVVFARISSFNHATTQNLVDELGAARRRLGRSMKGLVLDLRDNPGGLLDQAVSVADLFMTSGPIIATVGRNPASMQSFTAAPDDMLGGRPIVVLVNGGSASAAEIVAAALQDSGRAVVVGSASYGKGTVQTVLRLPNEGELTVTWARIVTPEGYMLNEHGVVPTVCTSGMEDSVANIALALQRGTAVAAPDTIAARPRAALDDLAWSALRRSCPAQTGDHALEVKVAARLLENKALYAHALHPAATVAARPARS